MHVMLRAPRLAGWLLLAAAPLAGAESPMPEPIAPAVIGRPLDQIRPRPMRVESATVKPRQVAVASKAASTGKPTPASKVAPAKKVFAAAKPVAAKPATPVAAAAKPAAPVAVAAAQAAAPVAVAAAAPTAPTAPAAPASPPAAKQAVDDRADPSVQVADNVGQGSHLARKRLAPGAYIGSRHQALVRKYYASNPVKGKSGNWQIGEPVPSKAALSGVPDDLRATLPTVPPGHQYVQVDGEVVLLAVQSRMVVDGVSRTMR
jgi:Ni/Co efflux regulator RcnB